MESALQLKSFPCAIHINDVIQRVSLDLEEPSPLLCVECILNSQASKPSNIVTLTSFIQKASDHYKTHKPSRKTAEAAPNDLVEFLSQENEVIERFSLHIESEKLKVTETIEKVLEMTKQLLMGKRDQLHQSLDLQLINLKANFAYYKGKIQSSFGSSPAEEEFQYNQEGLVTKINNLQSTNDLEIFVRLVREEMAAAGSRESNQDLINKLKELSKQLIQQSTTLPKCTAADPSKTEEILEALREQVSSSLQKNLTGVSSVIPKITLQACSSIDLQGVLDQLSRGQDKQRVFRDLVQKMNSKESLVALIKALNHNQQVVSLILDMPTDTPKTLGTLIDFLDALVQTPGGVMIPGITGLKTVKIIVDGFSSADTKVILKAINCLSILLEFGRNQASTDVNNPNTITVLLEEAGGLDKLEALQCHSSEEVYSKALEILEKYFNVEDY